MTLYIRFLRNNNRVCIDGKRVVFFFTKISLAIMLVGTTVDTSPELRPYHKYGILQKAHKRYVGTNFPNKKLIIFLSMRSYT